MGAQLGFSIGWTMLLTYPLMVAIQEISARLGRTTGHGIAGNLCRHYPPNWLLQIIMTLLFMANTIPALCNRFCGNVGVGCRVAAHMADLAPLRRGFFVFSCRVFDTETNGSARRWGGGFATSPASP